MNIFLGYITNVLEDARVYSEHAQKKELDVSDVKLAVQTRMDHSFTTPPPRDVSNSTFYCHFQVSDDLVHAFGTCWHKSD